MISKHAWTWLLLPALLAATVASTEDADILLRRGNEAYERGDFSAAIHLYEQAQVRSLQPTKVAFNLATAYYQLARSGSVSTLGHAETEYRACLGQGNPLRAAAYFGLGNCLLLRGTTGSLDRLTLRAAIDRYTECLRDPTCSPDLAIEARLNQQRARLFLLQAPPPEVEGPRDDPGSEDGDRTEPPEAQPTRNRDPQYSPASSESAPSTTPGQREPRPGATDPQSTRPAPGRGTLPPVPSSLEAPPLAEQDASLHLERVSARILDDLVRHRRARPRAATPGVKDW